MGCFMKLNISEMFTPVCTTPEDGEKLYEKIHPLLKAGNTVELDFSSVRFVSTLFFNAAIGQLYNDFSQEELDAKITYRNLIKAGWDILERVKENAPLFRNSVAQKQISNILSKEVELI